MFQRKSFKLLPFLMCISTVYSKNFTVNCYPRLTLIDVNEFLNVTCNFTSDDILSGEDFYQISVESSNDQVASCQNFIQIASIEEEMFRVNFVIKGNLVGWSSLKFAFKNSKNETFELPDTLSFGVLRTDGLLQTVFTVVVTILVVINTFVMGLQLDWRVILAIFKKPIAPLIGLFCQFICMPLLSFLWGWILLPGLANLQFGLFAVGCAPGGGASNFWCILLGGNVDLSVTMTFISSVAALAMMPLWLLTLGKYMTAGSTIVIPFFNIIISLVSLIIPCAVGILWKHYRPNVEEISRKIIKPITLILVGVIIVFGTYANWYIFSLVTWKSLLCGMLLPWSGFTVGFLIASLLRQGFVNALTVSIETGIQNAGISIIIVSFTLPHPDSDLTLIMPICAIMLTPFPLVVAFIFKTIWDCYNNRKVAKFSPVPVKSENIVSHDTTDDLLSKTPIGDK